MIVSPRFVIAHIPRTGGDAIKQITAALNLPDVGITPIHEPAKHGTPNLRGRDLILSIRRLPQRELSLVKHAYYAGQLPLTERRNPGETIGAFANRLLDGEANATRMTAAGQNPVAHFIRSENLREDLHGVLALYFPITEQQAKIIKTAPTKQRLQYDHDITNYFTHEQIIQLYQRSPTWAALEKRAYGHTPGT